MMSFVVLLVSLVVLPFRAETTDVSPATHSIDCSLEKIVSPWHTDAQIISQLRSSSTAQQHPGPGKRPHLTEDYAL